MSDVNLDSFLSQFRGKMEQDFEHWHTNTENRQIVPEGRRPCPICNQPMQSEELKSILIDVCPWHGSWFDHGELEGVLSLLEDEKEAACDQAYSDGYHHCKRNYMPRRKLKYFVP